MHGDLAAALPLMRGVRRHDNPRQPSTLPSPSIMQPEHGWLLILIGGVSGLMCWHEIALGRETMRWARTTGQVLGGTVGMDLLSGFGRLRADVRYRYTVNGTGYLSDRLTYRRYLTFVGADQAVYRYPVGATVTVWYDPGNPKRAVLEPGTGRLPWVYLTVAAGIMVAGVVMLGSRAV